MLEIAAYAHPTRSNYVAGRAGMESYEAYDTRHKKRCATTDHVTC